jgi:hypothetical protein
MQRATIDKAGYKRSKLYRYGAGCTKCIWMELKLMELNVLNWIGLIGTVKLNGNE